LKYFLQRITPKNDDYLIIKPNQTNAI